MGKKRLELLAPAKNLETGKAAIDHGADAVYIGAERLGARAAAGNSVSDIEALCKYAHPFGVKVYVTLNTLIRDDEVDYVEHLLRRLDEIGVDAILVQDMKLLTLVDEMDTEPAPTHLQLHASTQADNRTADKVRWLRDMGFSRAVLARELSLSEIRTIHEAVPDIELEAFVHGALCVCYSGQCYASERCLGRSANRGECAQMCRMRYDLIDANDNVLVRDRHLLSLKDLCQIDNLERLIDAGVTSFKIEGRLKDIGYVKNVTAAYNQRLQEICLKRPMELTRASRGISTIHFKPDPRKTFNRGFTTYFIDGRQPAIVSPFTPKSIGEPVGRVKDISRGGIVVSGTSRFVAGDGLCFFGNNHELVGFRVNKVEPSGHLIPLEMPADLRKGMPLFRNKDQEFERILSRQTSERKMPLCLRLEATDGGFRLEAWLESAIDEKASYNVEAEHQEAKTPQKDNILRQVGRLGGTPFILNTLDLPDNFPYFIPSSLLATMRRGVVDWLLSILSRPQPAEPFRLRHLSPPPDPIGFYGPLMTCRHCIKYELGLCHRYGANASAPDLCRDAPLWASAPAVSSPLREPLRLRLGDGREFRLEFDCRRCEMSVWEA